MFSYPEEDKMEKMTSLAIKGRESERYAGEKGRREGKDRELQLMWPKDIATHSWDGLLNCSKSIWSLQKNRTMKATNWLCYCK